MTGALKVFVGDTLVGRIILLNGDRTVFEFSEDYISLERPPVLSQSFLNEGKPVNPDRSYQQKLPPWFSNLLPEGALRSYLSDSLGIPSHREYAMLQRLGADLPGAVEVFTDKEFGKADDGQFSSSAGQNLLKFSLAGVQMKFSALKAERGRLTIPANGLGGDWILKFPSSVYAGVPENEATMLELARLVGISVPEFRLHTLDEISGLPEKVLVRDARFLAVKRFDRLSSGLKVHMEDFAQIFGVYPDDKYEKANYTTIANFIYTVIGEEALVEFVRRLAFSVLTGNGDMHLKNWSLLYPDGFTPILSPAYDLVSTISYIENDSLALNLSKEKSMAKITLAHFQRLAEKIGAPTSLVTDAVRDIVTHTRRQWTDVSHEYGLQAFAIEGITEHMKHVLI